MTKWIVSKAKAAAMWSWPKIQSAARWTGSKAMAASKWGVEKSKPLLKYPLIMGACVAYVLLATWLLFRGKAEHSLGKVASVANGWVVMFLAIGICSIVWYLIWGKPKPPKIAAAPQPAQPVRAPAPAHAPAGGHSGGGHGGGHGNSLSGLNALMWLVFIGALVWGGNYANQHWKLSPDPVPVTRTYASSSTRVMLPTPASGSVTVPAAGEEFSTPVGIPYGFRICRKLNPETDGFVVQSHDKRFSDLGDENWNEYSDSANAERYLSTSDKSFNMDYFFVDWKSNCP